MRWLISYLALPLMASIALNIHVTGAHNMLRGQHQALHVVSRIRKKLGIVARETTVQWTSASPAAKFVI